MPEEETPDDSVTNAHEKRGTQPGAIVDVEKDLDDGHCTVGFLLLCGWVAGSSSTWALQLRSLPLGTFLEAKHRPVSSIIPWHVASMLHALVLLVSTTQLVLTYITLLLSLFD